jgi:hypothetical protein
MEQEYLLKADWDKALSLWKLHAVNGVETNTSLPSFGFHASCVRDGKHVYKSEVIAGEIGSGVVEKFVSLTEFDMEIVCILLHNHLVCDKKAMII